MKKKNKRTGPKTFNVSQSISQSEQTVIFIEEKFVFSDNMDLDL